MNIGAAEVLGEDHRIPNRPAGHASSERVQPDDERVIGMPYGWRGVRLNISQVIPTAAAAACLVLQRNGFADVDRPFGW